MDPTALHALAADPDLPAGLVAHVVRAALATSDVALRQKLVARPDLVAPLRQLLLDRSGPQVLAAWAATGRDPQALTELVSSPTAAHRRWVAAMDLPLPDAALATLAGDDDPEVLRTLVGNLAVPAASAAEALAALAGRDPAAAAELLGQDSPRLVRVLAARPDLHDTLACRLLDGGVDGQQVGGLAGDLPGLSVTVWRRLATVPASDDFRLLYPARMARSPHYPDALEPELAAPGARLAPDTVAAAVARRGSRALAWSKAALPEQVPAPRGLVELVAAARKEDRDALVAVLTHPELDAQTLSTVAPAARVLPTIPPMPRAQRLTVAAVAGHHTFVDLLAEGTDPHRDLCAAIAARADARAAGGTVVPWPERAYGPLIAHGLVVDLPLREVLDATPLLTATYRQLAARYGTRSDAFELFDAVLATADDQQPVSGLLTTIGLLVDAA